jgi:hypothetical protein
VKRNFNVIVKDADGTPHVHKVFKTDEVTGLPVLESQTMPNGTVQKVQVFDRFEPMTMRRYVIDALSGRWAGEEKAPWSEVKKRGALLDRIIFGDGEVELDSTEVQIIKDALEHQGVSYYVMYRIGSMLDTDPPKAEGDQP